MSKGKWKRDSITGLPTIRQPQDDFGKHLLARFRGTNSVNADIATHFGRGGNSERMIRRMVDEGRYPGHIYRVKNEEGPDILMTWVSSAQQAGKNCRHHYGDIEKQRALCVITDVTPGSV